MRHLNRDVWIALILLLFCAVSFATTFNVRQTAYVTIGAEVWPRISIALMSVLCLIYLAQSLVQGGEPAEEPGPRGLRERLVHYRNPIWCFVLFAAFLITLPFFGMLIGGVLFVFAMLTVLGPRDVRAHLIHALVAVLSVGGMWAIFTYWLRVILPPGTLLRAW